MVDRTGPRILGLVGVPLTCAGLAALGTALACRMKAAQRGGLVGRRIGDEAFGNDNVNRVEQAFVLHDGGVDHRCQLQHHIAARIGESIPRGGLENLHTEIIGFSA
ncbi:hypothetical protein [Novosphingobium sp. BW1]|uniref:hypothetical protein n=1 Tax=Novosphingobium sp. BW1 TaxID=2592621 RepID=UPI001F07F392|nr:hypothetical protein [Novosphingobium sp. BW1]